jgi:hypothetical protein
VALSPSVGPFMHRRVSERALYWRRVIHLRTLKASGISSWYSSQTDRLQTICSKRRNIVFGALGPIRTCESNLKPLGNVFMVKAVELDIKLQNLANTPPLPPHGRDDYGQAAF